MVPIPLPKLPAADSICLHTPPSQPDRQPSTHQNARSPTPPLEQYTLSTLGRKSILDLVKYLVKLPGIIDNYKDEPQGKENGP